MGMGVLVAVAFLKSSEGLFRSKKDGKWTFQGKYLYTVEQTILATVKFWLEGFLSFKYSRSGIFRELVKNHGNCGNFLHMDIWCSTVVRWIKALKRA